MSIISFFRGGLLTKEDKKQLAKARKKAIPHLEIFKFHAEELNKFIQRGVVSRDREGKMWFCFLDHLASSLLALYKYNTIILYEHPYCTNHANIDENNLFRFQVDMVMSKAKHSFFTEYPKDSKIDLSNHLVFDIYTIGIKLFDELEQDQYKHYITSLEYKTFLMYDFIYYKDSGVFTKFELNYEKFQRGISLINSQMCKIDSNNISTLLDATYGIIHNVLKSQISDLTGESGRDIYKSFLDKCLIEENMPTVEPVSYYTAFKIWKMARIYQYRHRDVNHDVDTRDIVIDIVNYIKNVEVLGERVYFDLNSKKQKIQFFKKMHELDIDLSHAILHNFKRDNATDKIITNRLTNFNQRDEITIDKSSITSALQRMLIKNIQNNDSPHWKFNNILVHGTKKELLSIIYGFFSILPHTNKHLIGVHKSGGLISHCLNLCIGLNNPVLLFTSYPFIAINPPSEPISDYNGTFLLIDENYKTGFTTSIISEYMNRKHNININNVISIAMFSDYPNISQKDTNINYIANYHGKYIFTLNNNIKDIIDKGICNNIEEYIKTIYHNSANIFKLDKNCQIVNEEFEILLQKACNVRSDGSRILSDGTRALTNSEYLFTLASCFVRILISKFNINIHDYIYIDSVLNP